MPSKISSHSSKQRTDSLPDVQAGPNVFIRRTSRGFTVTSRVSARQKTPFSSLQLTLRRPPGFALPDGETRTPIFVSFGVVGQAIPTGIDDVVRYVTPSITETRYVFVKADLSDNNPYLVTAAEFDADSTTGADKETPAFDTSTYALPPYCYILIGRIVVTSGAISLNNTGNGSLCIAAAASNFACGSDGRATIARSLTYWRATI